MKGIGLKELKNLGSVGIRMMNKNLPSILSGFAIFGVVATAYTAFKAAPDVKSALNGKKWEKHDFDKDTDDETPEPELTPWETFTAAAPYIWKPVACGVFTVGCIIGAQVLNIQRLTMLAGAYKLSETKLKEYEAKAKEILGEKKAGDLRDAVAKETRGVPFTENTIITETGKGDVIFFDKFSGRYFKSSVETVLQAESTLNKMVVAGDNICLNDLYYELGLPNVKMGNMFGWQLYNGSSVDIHMTYDTQEINGEQKVICVLDYQVELDDRNFTGAF